ncbi:MAG TPA: glycosyltransferase [Anaerohalosphaeraceae bacterium]|jgi:dolichyl-phosphate beta-glucosyltransferase|nr:glycosyltransferase [Anaerohalosphaeraceae bacterium]HRT49631.1 glycosyltransferase [Anaerohalosphaeraceae bacterium]HRT85434.1 glycosyltransferase [Anaerohalosphaeraceae bacterium]
MSLSIIIPAFEEGKKIARDIREATAFLKDHDIAGEIIVVDDGSQDDTAEAAERVPATVGIPCHVFRLDVNRGKGFAVRTGVAKAIGDHIMFADSGCCVPYENVLRGLEMIDKGECEIAHGSRKMDGCRINRPQSRWRRVCSRLFRWVVHSWLRMPSHLTDTQCGFKVYRGDVAKKLYAEAITDGFSFDVEIIIRAHRYGYRIKEFPVEWTCDCDSRISLRRTSFRVMRELLRIKRVLGKEEVAAAAKTVQEA